MAYLNFDATQVAPELPRDPVPAGVYLAHIIESDVVATKSGGQMLKLTHQIIDGGACKGRLVWGNINTQNPSAEAERIGQSQLSALCHAVGVLKPTDSSMLHMIPVRMRVAIRPAGPDKSGIHRDAQNEVKGYESARGGAAPVAAGYPPATPTPPLSTAHVPPAAHTAPAAAPARTAPVWARRSAAV